MCSLSQAQILLSLSWIILVTSTVLTIIITTSQVFTLSMLYSN